MQYIQFSFQSPTPMIDNCNSSFYNNSHFSRCVSIVEKAIGDEGVVPRRYVQTVPTNYSTYMYIALHCTLHNKRASPCNSFSGQTLSDIYLLLIFARFLYLSIKIYSKLFLIIYSISHNISLCIDSCSSQRVSRSMVDL